MCIPLVISPCIVGFEVLTAVSRVLKVEVKVRVEVTLLITFNQSVCFGVELRLGPTSRCLLLFHNCCYVLVGRTL
jgi:hypothetical protein